MIASGLKFCCHCGYLASYAVIIVFILFCIQQVAIYIIYNDALQENDYILQFLNLAYYSTLILHM